MTDIQRIPLDRLVDSPSNPRKSFDASALAALAESVTASGVLQPILVRERAVVVDGNERDVLEYEIIAGHRRVRAARLAGLAEIPAILCAFTDREVLRVQLVENLQREDLGALEEAEGYQALIDHHGATATDIATQIGKSYEYVIARLKLLALGDECRAALVDGRISPSIAILLARLPRVIQPQALERILNDYNVKHVGLAPSTRRAAAIVREQYTRPIKGAPFDPKVRYFQPHPNELTPIAPPCAQCEKRTSCAADLFTDDPKAPDMCMDGECYDAKEAAEQREIIRRARDAGMPIIVGKEARRLMPNTFGDPKGHARAGGKTSDFGHWEKVSTLVKAAGEHAPAPVLFVNPHNGEPIEVYPIPALRAALEMSGYLKKGPDGKTVVDPRAKPARKEDPKQRAMRLAEERKHAGRMAIFRALRSRMIEVAAGHGGLPWDETVRDVCEMVLEMISFDDAWDALLGGQGAVFKAEDHHKLVRRAPIEEIYAIMWAATLAEQVEYVPKDAKADKLLDTAKRLGVDAAAIEAEAGAAFDAANPPPVAETGKKPAEKKPAQGAKGKSKSRPATTPDLAAVEA